MIDIANIEEPIEDSAAGRREALLRFISQARNGRIQPGLLAFVAELVEQRLEKIAPLPGRPRLPREDKFLAWFAVECDPEYATLPRTREGRFAAIGALLNQEASGVERDAAAFGRRPRLTDFLLLADQGQRYAELKIMPWPESVEIFAQWFDDAKARKNSA